MALTDDELKRLPPEVREATLAQQRLEAEALSRHIERNKKTGAAGAALGAVGAMLVELLSGPAWPMYFFIALAGGASGFWTVLQRYKILGGAVTVGGACIVANVIGIAIGWVTLTPDVGTLMVLLCSWLLYLALGAAIGAWADGERFRHSAGY